MKVDNREAPFSDAEGGSKAMRDKLRTYEDQVRRGRRVAAQDGGGPEGAVPRQGGSASSRREGRERSRQSRAARRLHGGAEESERHLVHRGAEGGVESGNRRCAPGSRACGALPSGGVLGIGRGAAAGSGSGVDLCPGGRRSGEPGRARRARISAGGGGQRQTGRDSVCGRKFGTAAGPGRMDRLAGESADRARDGESPVAASLRRRHRADAERFRNQRRPAFASRAARLSRHAVCREEVEHEGDAQDDAALEHLSPVDRESRAAKPTPRPIRRICCSGG